MGHIFTIIPGAYCSWADPWSSPYARSALVGQVLFVMVTLGVISSPVTQFFGLAIFKDAAVSGDELVLICLASLVVWLILVSEGKIGVKIIHS